MRTIQVEICAGHLGSAQAAQQAGAHRIELCSALEAGGLTPSAGLIRAAVQGLHIPVHVLIRPREGDFCYSTAEVSVMCHDIQMCRAMGAAGVVIGALDTNGRLHTEVMPLLIEAAGDMHITCHRAFDFVPDAAAALEQLVDWEVGRVLSSGQAATAWEGRHLLKKLVLQAAGRITIMPGAGISPQNIQPIRSATGATDFHLSAKRRVVSPSEARPISGLEWAYWQSDEHTIREALSLLT